MKNFFKPSDFPQPRNSNLIDVVSAADIANAKLAKEIESWPVVYGIKDEERSEWIFTQSQEGSETHTARLAFIEELPKRECAHEPEWTANGYICTHCRKELIAEWKVRE